MTEQYYGLRPFADKAGVSYKSLRRWRIYGPCWVPEPDVMIGDLPGWSGDCIATWTPHGKPYVRPKPKRYIGVTAMMDRHRCSHATLMQMIAGGEISEPPVAIDGKPGWAWTPPAHI